MKEKRSNRSERLDEKSVLNNHNSADVNASSLENALNKCAEHALTIRDFLRPFHSSSLPNNEKSNHPESKSAKDVRTKIFKLYNYSQLLLRWDEFLEPEMQ